MENKEISWEEHIKSYFLEENTNRYNSSKSVEKVIKVYYRFPEDKIHRDTGSSIVLYRHDPSSFHPRINPQLRGSTKANKWLDEQNKNKTPYKIPAPYNLKDRVSLCTTIRFTFYEKMKGWFYRYYVPHILAIMIEKDFGYEITGTRKSSKIFTFDLD